jgi:hypothetical protein
MTDTGHTRLGTYGRGTRTRLRHTALVVHAECTQSCRAGRPCHAPSLAVILEENDNTTTQVANAERRNALRTRVHDAPADTGAGGLSELARLQDEVNELKRALSTRAPLPLCGDCGFGHKGICIGKEVATNKMTKDAAKQCLGPAIKDKDAAVDRCIARYKAFNGIDDTPTDGGTPFRPAKKLVACTRVSIGATGVNNSPTDADCTNRLPKSHFSFAVW